MFDGGVLVSTTVVKIALFCPDPSRQKMLYGHFSKSEMSIRNMAVFAILKNPNGKDVASEVFAMSINRVWGDLSGDSIIRSFIYTVWCISFPNFENVEIVPCLKRAIRMNHHRQNRNRSTDYSKKSQ